jgi:hypothetical protein
MRFSTQRLSTITLLSATLVLLGASTGVAQSLVRTVPLYRWLRVYPTDAPQHGLLPHDAPRSSYHYYTIRDPNREPEVDLGGSSTLELIAGYVLPSAVPGTVELKWLLHDNRPFDNFMTTDVDEANKAVARSGYRMWSNCRCYAAATQLPGTVPLFRLVKESHFYTTDPSERDRAVSDGYTFEGTTAYVWTKEVAVADPTTGATRGDNGSDIGMSSGDNSGHATNPNKMVDLTPTRSSGSAWRSSITSLIVVVICAMIGTALVVTWQSRRNRTKKAP